MAAPELDAVAEAFREANAKLNGEHRTFIERDVRALRLPDGSYAVRDEREPGYWHVAGRRDSSVIGVNEAGLLQLLLMQPNEPTHRIERDCLPLAPRVVNDVLTERRRQDVSLGARRELPGEVWATMLSKEVGEVARAVLEGDRASLREELVQVAAVAFAMLEAIDDGRL